MILAKLFTKIFKEGGIILIDSENQKYICGSPRQINPITLKLLKNLFGYLSKFAFHKI